MLLLRLPDLRCERLCYGAAWASHRGASAARTAGRRSSCSGPAKSVSECLASATVAKPSIVDSCAQSTCPGDQLASGEPSRLGHSTGLYTIEESEAHIAHNILQPGVVGSQGYGTTDTETDTGNYRLNQPGMRSVCGQGSGTRPSAESVAENGTAFNLWSLISAASDNDAT